MKNKIINYKPGKISVISFRRFSRKFTDGLHAYEKADSFGSRQVIFSSLQENLNRVILNSSFENYQLVLLFYQMVEEHSVIIAVRFLLNAMKQVKELSQYQNISALLADFPEDLVSIFAEELINSTDQSTGKPLLADQPEKYLPDAIIYLSFLNIDRSSKLVAELKSIVPADRFRLLIKSLKNKNITDLGEMILDYLYSKKNSNKT